MYISIYIAITYSFNSRELQTTETEDIAMAMLGIQGCILSPSGANTPAANGIPIALYSTAQAKFSLIRWIVFLERSIATTTSRRSSYQKRDLDYNQSITLIKFNFCSCQLAK